MNRNYNSKKNNSKITSPLLTALYCRLSLEDGKDNESMSISNQKLLLKDYAEKNGMFNCEFFIPVLSAVIIPPVIFQSNLSLCTER